MGDTRRESPPAGPAATGHRALRFSLVAVALLLPLAYALYTSQAWEDFFITYRHSVHLVQGDGLSYEAGRRLQGFSSPLAALLLAACHLLTGSASPEAALWLFRVPAAVGFAAGLGLLLRGLARGGTASHPLAMAAPALVYLLDVKGVMFAANGMETGLLLGCLGGALGELAAGRPRSARLGVWWAGMLWTRPDAAVAVAAMVAAHLALGRSPSLARSDPPGPVGGRGGEILRAAGIAGAGYLPWLGFAWLYYGSPVPQPALAKAANAGMLSPDGLLAGVARIPEILAALYRTPYAEYGPPGAAAAASAVVAAAACGYGLWPRGRRLGRIASWVTLAHVAYLAQMPRVYPWYIPAAVAASVPALAALLQDLLSLRRLPRVVRRAVLPAACAIGLAGLAWAGYACAAVGRVVQQLSEDGNRRPLGLWLSRRADPAERVYLECPGYIGYYSGLQMLDYPGLVAPQVVAARRALGDDFATVGMALRPEWLVLRTEEVALFEAARPGWLREAYRHERSFDVTERLRAAVPDEPGILYDGVFHVLRRR